MQQPLPTESQGGLQGIQEFDIRTHEGRLAHNAHQRAIHDRLLTAISAVQELDAATGEIEPSVPIIYEKIDGQVTNTLDFDFETRGLPTPPDGETPLAIVTNRDGERVTGLALVTSLPVNKRNDDLRLRVRYLQQTEDLSDTATELEPEWVMPGYAGKTGFQLTPRIIADNDSVLTIAIGQRGYAEDDEAHSLNVYRSGKTMNELSLSDVEGVNRKSKRFVRLRKWLAGVALVSGVAGATYNPETPAPTEIVQYSDAVYDEEAVARTEQSLELFKSGNTDELAKIAEQGGFSTESVSPELQKQIEEAESIEQIEALINKTLETSNISFSVLKEEFVSTQKTYDRAPENINGIQQTAIGILEGLNRLGPIATEGEGFDIRIVGEITDNGDNDGSDGTYQHGFDGEKAVIYIKSQTSPKRSKSVTIHESGHHKNLGDKSVSHGFSRLDGGQISTTDEVIGRDIVSDYAKENLKEETADMIEHLFGDAEIDPENSTLLQEKLKFVMAELEAEYPGASAAILLNAERAKQDWVDNLENGVNKVQNYGRGVFVLSVMLEIATLVALRKNRQLELAQRQAGARIS